ncbi:MAG: MBL fold metallo-hydrolase, partial [Erysipelotrichaceae bacterium]|nr:MBL fold metallo-hydrolase [Erysipelotrichaceae bacterium]
MNRKETDVIMPKKWYDALPRRQYESFIKVRSADPWFNVFQIRSNIFAIYEDKHFQEVISSLIIGTEKSLMIDTGLGIGNIKAVVDRLYDGEIIVVHTHTHFDHIGGDWQFQVINTPDHPVAVARAEKGLSHEEIADNMAEGSNAAPYPEGFDENAYFIKPANS